MNCLVFGDKLLLCEVNFVVIRIIEDNEEYWLEVAVVVRRDIFVDDFYLFCVSVEYVVNLY